MTARERRVLVVGAGPAGLAAAVRLQRLGWAVTVREARPHVGGRTYTDELDGYRVDTGTQQFASMFTRLFRMLDEVGLGERLVRASGRDALWRGGRAHEVVYGSVPSMLSSGALPWRVKMRLGTTYVPFLTRHAGALHLHAPERVAAEGLDRDSIAHWGERELGREFVDYLAYPQLASFYGATPEETSEGFYHVLAHHGLDVGLFALRGGMGALCETLAERVRRDGGTVRTASPVERVEVESDGVRVNGDGGEERYPAAVVAVPAPAAVQILAHAPRSLMEWLSGVRHGPALTLALLLDQPAGVRFFGLSFPREASRVVSAVCVEENKAPGLVPEGRGLLVAFAAPGGVDDLIEADARTVMDRMLPDVARAFPGVESRLVRARVYRWPIGNPIFYPGYLRHLTHFRSGAVEGAIPLAIAGDYLSSPTVEGAVTAGLAAADRLVARLGAAVDRAI